MKSISARNSIITVDLRSKFLKQLAKLPEANQEAVKQAINTYVNSKDDETCFDILWKLTYDPADGLEKIGLCLETDPTVSGSDITSVTAEFVQPLRNELRYQRKQVNPSFMELDELDISEKCKSAYKALCNVTADAIIAIVAYNHCYKFCQLSDNEDEYSRVHYLLSSTKESYFYGGIRSLHFKKEEADCLKKYASQLSELLDVLWNEKASFSEQPNTPLATQLEAWKKANPDFLSDSSTENVNQEIVDELKEEPINPLPDVEASETTTVEEAPKEVITEVKAKVKNLTPITAPIIAENTELFKAFLDSYHDIIANGFDPSQVIANAEAITMISEASKLLKN